MSKQPEARDTGLRDVLHEPAQPQNEPLHRGDNPSGRMRGHVTARSARHAPGEHPFDAAELNLINAFLAFRGYPEARATDPGIDPDRRSVMSRPDADDEGPTILIGKRNDKFWFSVVEHGDEGGAGSFGYENVESLPVVLAMIDAPDQF